MGVTLAAAFEPTCNHQNDPVAFGIRKRISELKFGFRNQKMDFGVELPKRATRQVWIAPRNYPRDAGSLRMSIQIDRLA